VAALSVAASARATVPAAGLVANYEFSGNANDKGPNALHGTVSGATLTSDRFGVANAAYQFDGAASYIQIADHDVFSLVTSGAFSVSVWMRPDVLTFADEEGSGYVHWMGKGSTGQHEWVWRMYGLDNTEGRENRTSSYVFNLSGGLGAGSYVQETVTPGVWNHYVVTISMASDLLTLYKNGVQKDADTFQDSEYNIVPANGTAPVRIGTRDFASYFQGAVDDVRFYDRVLTLAEIQQLYADDPHPTPTATPRPTATATPRPTATARPTATLTPTSTPTATPRPGLRFSASVYTVGEPTPLARVTVLRTGDLSSSVSVRYATSNGSAAAGSDYAAKSGTLSFAAGISARTFSVRIFEDAVTEGLETLSLALSAPSAPAQLTAPATARLRITDNDGRAIYFTAVSYAVTEGQTDVIVDLALQRSGALSSPASVTVKTIPGGTATAGSDFKALSRVVTLPAGVASVAVPLTILGGVTAEGPETVKVQLSAPSGGVLGTQRTTTVTIIDND
jgi:hypothetical protein